MGGGAQQVYEGVGAQLYSVAVSADGELLAAVGENGTVVLFDVTSGSIRQRLEGHTGLVNDVAFDPDGTWLVTGGDDEKVIRWSLPTGNTPAEQLQAWGSPGQVWSVVVSPDGRLLATGGTAKNISLWQAETGEFVRRLEGHTDVIAHPVGRCACPPGIRTGSSASST
jgi:WD40 repeat protein